MDSIELELDALFFDEDVIARTAYRYSGDFYVLVKSAGANHVVTLRPRTSDVDMADLAARFQTDACDDRLRAQVALQTGDLQRLLMRAALESAEPKGDGRL
ncbi:His-Xaa-Ser system protein HxsD [Pseudoxanthomonas sp. LARHCG66]